jgi:Ni/Fe-hydrogenase 1 B-type cytochrome subunit
LHIKYVWEIPVRITHWVTMVCILTLSVTGFMIGNPTTLAASPSQFVMGWIRFIHFTTAYIFAIGLAIRLYWSLVGNKYANWRTFFPWTTAEGRQKMMDTFKYYSFIQRRVPHVVGHNTLAAATYSLVMMLYLMMIATGFALYTEHRPGSTMHLMFGWLTDMLANQYLRLGHHLGMWLILGFAIHHIYSAWLMDIKERGGVISSMFSGYKSIEGKE